MSKNSANEVREKILELLEEGPLSVPEIAKISGYDRRRVQNAMNTLRGWGRVHVIRHEQQSKRGGPKSPVYAKARSVDFPLHELWRGVVAL